MVDEQQEQQHETVTTTGRNLHKLLSVVELMFEIDLRSDGSPVVVVVAAVTVHAVVVLQLSLCMCNYR